MNKTIEILRDRMTAEGISVDVDRVFDLLDAVACEQCCTKSDGGNGSCPPPKLT
ncbi:MAG TPA: hypothetical protein VFP80_10815 [Thermoanaerobaculia bacterium]|nr:hypothetical protein [Thermoanaerobaculia bacterium]